jgi:hypothetical protein
MPGKLPCWFEQVADEFDRVAKQVVTTPAASATQGGKELAMLAAAIRADCPCGGHADGGHADHCENSPPPK